MLNQCFISAAWTYVKVHKVLPDFPVRWAASGGEDGVEIDAQTFQRP
jgi:hypothetical protein